MNITKRKPTHPGEILHEEVIKPLKLTITDAAMYLGVTRKTLSELVHGHSKLSPEMAYRIGKATNTSPAIWYEMQARLDMWEVMNNGPSNVSTFPKTA